MFEKFYYKKEALRTLGWLQKSFQLNEFCGSAAKYSHPVYRAHRGWAKPYPETTGYILPTLFRYKSWSSDFDIDIAIFTSSNWLSNIQNLDGSFPGGFKTTGNPSVFNTAQILLGLYTCIEHDFSNGSLMYTDPAFNYLFNSANENGEWIEGNYVKGFNPTYYSRVLWPMIEYDFKFKKSEHRKTLEKYALHYFKRYNENGSFKDWGFEKGKPAYTHTIAYTLRGFLEIANSFGNDEILAAVKKSMLKLQSTLKDNLLAGMYDENWTGDYTFTCPTGNLQLAIIAFMLADGQDVFFQFGETLITENIKFQKKSFNKNLNGAIPGSVPLSGPYQKYAYPNWAAKFFLDAIYIYNQKNNFA